MNSFAIFPSRKGVSLYSKDVSQRSKRPSYRILIRTRCVVLSVFELAVVCYISFKLIYSELFGCNFLALPVVFIPFKDKS